MYDVNVDASCFTAYCKDEQTMQNLYNIATYGKSLRDLAVFPFREEIFKLRQSID